MIVHLKGTFVDLVDMTLRYEFLMERKPTAAPKYLNKRKFNHYGKKI